MDRDYFVGRRGRGGSGGRGRGRGRPPNTGEDIICTTEGISCVMDRNYFVGRRGRGGSGGRGRGRGRPPNTGEGRQSGPHLGYRKLQEIRSTEPSEMAMTLLKYRDSFEVLVNAEDIKEDWMTLLVEILGKMCDTMMTHNLIEVMSICKGSALMATHLPKYILNLPFIKEDMNSDQFSLLVECLLTFFKEWLAKLPHSFCHDVPIDKLSGVINDIDVKGFEKYKKEVETLLLERREQIRKGREVEQASKWPKVKPQEVEPPPPNDFREISIYPSETEINSEERAFLRRNRTAQTEKYKDLNDYLDVQFRLLREDFVAPLREGIREIKKKVPKKSRSQDLNIYENVEIMNTGYTMAGVVHSIRLVMKNLKKIPWEHSKRLLYGSFLCLSKDNFKTMLFATVANRKPQDLRSGKLDIRFVDDLEGTHRMLDKYVMVESPAYFEAYRPILHQLKYITTDTFPFQEYLVHCNPDVKPPQYLKSKNQVCYDLRETLSVLEGADKVVICNFETWPDVDDVKLNNSQFQALKGALTKEFSVIQGPPGTGKTYVGLKIVRALLDNKHVWNEEKKSAMLMVCYTNHALDQFLEGVLKFQQTGVIRVGGRSSSESLKAYNLQEHTQPSDSKRWVRQEMTKCQDAIQRARSKLARSKRNILRLEDLHSYVGPKHFGQFKARENILNLQGKSVLENWLGLEQILVTMRSSLNETPTAESVADKGSSREDANEVMEDNIEVDRDAEIIQNQRLLGENQFQLLKKQDNTEREKQYPTNLSEDHLKVLAGESKLQPLSVTQLPKINNVWNLPFEDRWRLYLFWLRLFQSYCQEDISQRNKQYEDICKRFTEIKTQGELQALKDAVVIGMTTTGAAKYRALLEEIKPTIVVVEEAAEVLEAHIITSLTKNTQHLILIGDHQQLRPNPSVYTLAKDYHLDVSLFERMVNSGMTCYQLNTQHRMRPEIARLMRFIYDDLQDHEEVHEYENVKGVSKNIYFINHQVLEDESEVNDRLKSHSNKHEATFIAALCEYFILQGYAPHEITVLTMYTGQVITLQRTMPKDRFEGVRVTAVDNFQGEENEIILLSLVRSNKQRKIGFLAVKNRVCVALSRARKGFYCIGNFSLLAEKSELWKRIAQDMKDHNAIGEALELVCSKHPDRKIHARVADDFKSAPEGGCTLPCKFRLPCGHSCTRVCHPDDSDHALYKCQKDCSTEVCSEHQTKCSKKCHFGEVCLVCPVEVEKKIPKCGHQQLVPCGISVETFKCQKKCWNYLPCRHLCPGKCWEECALFQCEKIVKKRFECGHEIEKPCWEVSEYAQCEEPCRATLDCGHPCVGNCRKCKQGRIHVPCEAECDRRRVCLHPCKEPCTTNCPPCPEKCENRCYHSRCPRQCMEACAPCRERCAWVCPHFKCTKLCGEKCNRPRCNESCRKKLRCSHSCIGICGEPCPKLCRICHKDEVTQLHFGTEQDKNARFIELSDCEHVVEVTAMDYWMDKDSGSDDIKLKQCPICQTPIRISYRYADIVKEKLASIEKIKARMNLEEENYQQLTKKLKTVAFSLKRKYPEISRQRKSLLERKHNDEQMFSSSSYDILMGWLQQRKTMAELSTIKNQMKILIQIYKIRERMKLDLLKKTRYGVLTPPSASHSDDMFLQAARDIDEALDHLEEDLMKFQVSYQRLVDIRDELVCVSFSLNIRVIQCKIEEGSITVASDQEKWLKTLGRKLDAGQKLGKEAYDHIEDTINEIREECGLESLPAEERIKIFRPINFYQGLWHKCPNGHPSNVEGECPECGAAVGDRSDTLAQGNQIATAGEEALYTY